MINQIELDTKLQTGLLTIDNQHKVLFDLTKDFSNAVTAGMSKKILDTLLGVLRDYAFHHFQTEEDLFAEHESFQVHCLEHYKLIKQLNAFIIDFKNDRMQLSLISPFLHDWLTLHIERFDQPLLIGNPTILPLTVDRSRTDDLDEIAEERRQHKRLVSNEVVDGEILANCYNATRLTSGTARIINMSPGGLLLGDITGHEVSDLLIMSCTIGKNFKMKEKVMVKSVQDKTCGVQFIAPAEDTVRFFTNLYGSVYLNRAKI